MTLDTKRKPMIVTPLARDVATTLQIRIGQIMRNQYRSDIDQDNACEVAIARAIQRAYDRGVEDGKKEAKR